MKLFTPKHQITIFSPASSTIILNYRNMPLSKPYHVVVIIIITTVFYTLRHKAYLETYEAAYALLGSLAKGERY